MAKMVMWSEMKGRVLMNGKPASGAVLTRNFFWQWKSEKGSDQATANAAGEFSFPTIERSSFVGGLLPHQPVIEQVMKIEYQGKTYDAWAFFKYSYENDSETKGKPINLTCRLEAELALHGEVTTICEFN